MNRTFKNTICSLMTLVFVPSAVLALETEYKNSLTKVELKQTSDSNYDVNLYMQKKFNEPVKVIKKNDLNYYILLPETKNAVSGVSKTGSDIKDASANSHKYAGADVNNGYTKINISTTKPVNFNINVRNTSDVASRTKTVSAAASATDSTAAPRNIQKKNSDSSVIQNTQAKAVLKQKKETPEIKKTAVAAQAPVKKQLNTASAAKVPVPAVSKNAVKIQPKIEDKKTTPIQVQKESVKKVQKPLEQKETQKGIQKETLKPVQNKPVQDKAIQNNPAPKQKPAEAPITKTQIKEEREQIPLPPVLNTDMEETEPKIINEGPVETLDVDESENLNSISDNAPFGEDSLKDKFISKITEYGLCISDIIFMFFAGLISLIALFVILRKPSKSQAKLKTKADLIEKLDKTERFVPKKTAQPAETAQYFVFDKNVKQTAFMDPGEQDNKKHYELSNYDPDINAKYGEETQDKESEYDIIQKILKEDALVEIVPQEFEPKIYTKERTPKTTEQEEQEEQEAARTQKPAAAVKEEPVLERPLEKLEQTVKQPASEYMTEQKSQDKLQEITAPRVLSSIEIAPERGFMVVSYNNNINLMGYIFDDVFALYNFKRQHLADNEIKYRLSDKDDKGTNFIVKVDNSKVVVRVTKSQMNLLVVM